jgi:phosphoribosylformylglycinamidine synthase subunit PurSL
VNKAITMDLKSAGNSIYLIGEFIFEQKAVPDVPTSAPNVYRALHQAITNGLIRSAHDLSEGGLAITAAEMCIGGRLGMNVNFESKAIFNEVNGCLLVEVTPENASAFEKQFTNLPFNKIGEVTSNLILNIPNTEINVDELVHAFNNPKTL